MHGRKRPTAEDAVNARRILLSGLARGAELDMPLLGELAPLHPRNDTFPDEVFLRLAACALDWCGASRTAPMELEGIRERYLPECAFRGRQSQKFRFAVLAAAAVHGGTEPDLLDEVSWWASDDFWHYAALAARREHRLGGAASTTPEPAVSLRRAWRRPLLRPTTW